MNYQIQLNVQLLDLSRLIQTGTNKLLQFARSVRKTGSDIIVEEDLADIFGRGRIVPAARNAFKDEVLRNTNILPLFKDSQLELSSGAGVTLNRALVDKNPKYLSAIIQLSFLAYTHDRISLASTISQCMFQRSGEGLSFESIESALQALSTQASVTLWTAYIDLVKTKLLYDGQLEMGLLDFESPQIGLNSTVMLAAMDFFYLVQMLPENRKAMIKTSTGIMSLVVWTHHILGLTVQVQGAAGKLSTFGDDDSPGVIISFSGDSLHTDEALLLDADMEIVLRCVPDQEFPLTSPRPEERHTLQDYGTQRLRRLVCGFLLIPDDDSLYHDIVVMILAMALNASSRLCSENAEEDHVLAFQSLAIEPWRVYNAAKVVFHSVDVKKTGFRSIMESLKGCSIQEVALHPSVSRFQKEVEPESSRKSFEKLLRDEMCDLTLCLLAFAHGHNIEKCGAMPLALRLESAMDQPGELWHSITHKDLGDGRATIRVVQNIFRTLAIVLLLGHYGLEEINIQQRAFIHGDFGWSIVHSSVGAVDPGDVKPSMFHIRQGIPTNAKTGEQRRFVCDEPQALSMGGTDTLTYVVDRGRSYVPRSLTKVTKWKQYYTTRAAYFSLTLAIDVELGDNSKRHTLHTSYGFLHSTLWHVRRTAACNCAEKAMATAPLGPGVVTIGGYVWLGSSSHDMKYPSDQDRICIFLAKEHRARWYAIMAARGSLRKLVLKTHDCCEKCALEAASSLAGTCIPMI